MAEANAAEGYARSVDGETETAAEKEEARGMEAGTPMDELRVSEGKRCPADEMFQGDPTPPLPLPPVRPGLP